LECVFWGLRTSRDGAYHCGCAEVSKSVFHLREICSFNFSSDKDML
jgi:hypothetical protein